MVKLAGVT